MVRAVTIVLSLVIWIGVCAQNNVTKIKTKLTKPAVFRVVKLGEPTSYIGHYADNTEIQKTELVKIDSLKVKYCFNLPSEFIVLKYKFSGFVKGQYFSCIVKGCSLTPEIKNILAKTVNGDKIHFTGIIAAGKDSAKKKFPDINIKVIDKKDTGLITYKLKNKIPEPDLFSVKKQLPIKITRLELMFVDQLFVKCDCRIPLFKTEFQVIAFELRTSIKGNKMIFSAKGSDLTQEMREALQHTHTGTKFRIENIQVKTNDGIVGYLSPRTFKIIAP